MLGNSIIVRSGTYLPELTVTGTFTVTASNSYFSNVNVSNYLKVTGDDRWLQIGNSGDFVLKYQTADADAKIPVFMVDESGDSGNNVPAFAFAEHTAVSAVDLNLLDEVVQPHIVILENNGKYASDTAMTAAGAQTTMTKTGEFASSAVGDIVRVTGGTNATAGWYWITTVTDNDNIVLDRNWCTGAVTDGAASLWHKVGMITPKAFYIPIYDGAPDDDDIDIDMDGAFAIDVNAKKLYHRSQTVWYAVQNCIVTAENHTADDTLAIAESGSVHTNYGEDGNQVLTLPASAPIGTNFKFVVAYAGQMQIKVGAAADVYIVGGATQTDDGGGDGYLWADDEGEMAEFVSLGAGVWLVHTQGTWTWVQP